jgi:hypothetical protein
MTLEFVDNPTIKKGHRIKSMVEELKLFPNRWAVFYVSPEMSRKYDTEFSSKLVRLRRDYPEIHWEKAVTETFLQIVGRFEE